MIERASAGARLELRAHPHMLRHACGYALANKGHNTRAIQGWLDTGRSPAPRSIQRWRRTGSRTSGGSECLAVALH
jgi:integrase